VDRARIVFFTNATSQLSLPVLKALQSSDVFDVVHVFFFDTIAASKGRLYSVIRRHGLKKTLKKIVEVIAAKLMPKLTGRSAGDVMRSCRDYAVAADIPFSVVRSINDPSVVQAVSGLNPDLLVCCSFSQIMKSPILKTPRLAAVNIHPSLLPKYRGPLPSFWAIYNGEHESGVTFHLMQTGIDEGLILKQFSLPIDSKWNESELTSQLFELAAQQVATVLQEFLHGECTPVLQDETQATYFSFPTPKQRREFEHSRRR
jgi:methionyl-tRNA formyltransferase